MVFWSAAYGGAETSGLSLVPPLRGRGIDIAVVFICRGGPLEARLQEEHIPYEVVAVDRGSDLILRPWRLARALAALDVDAVILPTSGFLVTVTRLAGFWGPLIAVEHGDVLQMPNLPAIQRARQHVDRLVGAPFISEIVAVSDYIRRAVERLPHAATVTTIPNGVDVERFFPISPPRRTEMFRVGTAARLIPGKGVDVLIRALGSLRLERPWQCVIAGDGPQRDHLELLAKRTGVFERIRFSGWVEDMVAFWQSCDVAVTPSFEFVESFGMTAVEAMACGIPVIATRNGGLTEVVLDSQCGVVVDAGDAHCIASALQQYAREPDRCQEHGARARHHCERSFDVRDRADRYLTLLGW